FEVGASFGGVPERLVVPFAAIKRFSDPSVQFGLQFEILMPRRDQTAEEITPASPASSPSRAEAGKPKRSPVRPKKEEIPKAASKDSSPGEADGEKEPSPRGGGEIVRLDRFRKK